MTISVRHLGGDRFNIEVRGHVIGVDQPVADGGDDTAPTPTELFVAGLASCAAFYARRFLDRHGLSSEGLAVTADYAVGGRPARVEDIALTITPPASLPPNRVGAFLAVASHCTVHNSLAIPPAVVVRLDTAWAA